MAKKAEGSSRLRDQKKAITRHHLHGGQRKESLPHTLTQQLQRSSQGQKIILPKQSKVLDASLIAQIQSGRVLLFVCLCFLYSYW